jgi:hypothetical protein
LHIPLVLRIPDRGQTNLFANRTPPVFKDGRGRPDETKGSKSPDKERAAWGFRAVGGGGARRGRHTKKKKIQCLFNKTQSDSHDLVRRALKLQYLLLIIVMKIWRSFKNYLSMGGVQQRWARLTFGWATVEEISLLQKRKQPQSQDTPLGTHSQFFRANLTNVAPDLSQPTPSVFFFCVTRPVPGGCAPVGSFIRPA